MQHISILRQASFALAVILGVSMILASIPTSIALDGARAQESGPEDTGWAPETFTLDNGMQVVVLSDHRLPVVTHMVWYRVGAADEPIGKSGIAHFLEHLMFKGTRNVPPGELSKIVARNGGQDNAFTSQDYTAYFQRVALDRLPLVMKLEADRMSNLILTDEVVDPERDVVLEERSSRVGNNPESILSEQSSAALFMAHPYGIPIIGWEHEIRELNTSDAVDFYNAHYAPNNAILIVAGDITAEQLRPLAEQFYGSISQRVIERRVRPKEPPAVAPRRINYRDARVRQPSFRRSYIAPTYATADDGTAEALDVLAHLLGTGSTSRFYRTLVVESALAANAAAFYSGSSLDYGRFGFFASPRPETDLESLEEAVDAVIESLLADGVTEEEVERAKSALVADAVFARDNQQFLAQAYGVGLTTGETVEQVTTYPDRVEKVTADDVNRVAQIVFANPAQVTAYLQPEQGS